MKKLLIIGGTIVAAVLIFFFFFAKPDDLDGLGGGAWTMVGMETRGKRAGIEPAQRLKVRFERGKATWILPAGGKEIEIAGPLKVNASAKPKEIDLFMPPMGPDEPEEIALGIYEVKDDTLVICMGADRPVEFSTKSRTPQVIWVFKR